MEVDGELMQIIQSLANYTIKQYLSHFVKNSDNNVTLMSSLFLAIYF